jgi:hypothetical protein
MAAEFIPPGVYPVLPGALSRQLRDPAVTAAVQHVLTDNVASLADVVHAVIAGLNAQADPARLYENAHEIRGLAGNAGLAATARIAAGLCRYLDAAAGAPEMAVLQLHIEALARTARAGDGGLSEAVALELGALVARKLAEIKASETTTKRDAV